jgi:hypothetical protein
LQPAFPFELMTPLYFSPFGLIILLISLLMAALHFSLLLVLLSLLVLLLLLLFPSALLRLQLQSPPHRCCSLSCSRSAIPARLDGSGMQGECYTAAAAASAALSEKAVAAAAAACSVAHVAPIPSASCRLLVLEQQQQPASGHLPASKELAEGGFSAAAQVLAKQHPHD